MTQPSSFQPCPFRKDEPEPLHPSPGPPRCIASGVRWLKRAQARFSKPRLTLHPSYNLPAGL